MGNRKRVVYFSAGVGAGGVFRALALHKAFKRLEAEVEFVTVVISDYHQLLEEWKIPSLVAPYTTKDPFDRVEMLSQALWTVKPDVLITSFHVAAGQGSNGETTAI